MSVVTLPEVSIGNLSVSFDQFSARSGRLGTNSNRICHTSLNTADFHSVQLFDATLQCPFTVRSPLRSDYCVYDVLLPMALHVIRKNNYRTVLSILGW